MALGAEETTHLEKSLAQKHRNLTPDPQHLHVTRQAWQCACDSSRGRDCQSSLAHPPSHWQALDSLRAPMQKSQWEAAEDNTGC